MKFHKETEFQETEIGEIPRDWKVVEFGVLFDFQRGLSYRKNDISTFQTPIRFITINDLEKEGGRKRDVEPIYLSEELEDSIINKKCTVEIGDILIAITDMSKGFIIGAPLYIDETLRNQGDTLVYSMDLVKLLPKRSLNTKFYFYLLSWERVRKIMKSLARGTNVLHLDLNLTKKLKVIEPPLEEQGRIANILSTIDRTIELYHRESERLERLKRGLMSELLTGRIRVREENDKLSFYREMEFQETEISEIPREWKTVKLSSIARIIMGQSPPSDTYNREGLGMPFLQGKMEFGRMYPSPTIYTTQPLKIAEPNDILISVRAPVGDVNIAPYKVCIGRGLAAIRFNLKTANHMFYFYYFQYIKKQLVTLGKGSTFKAITKKDLEELLIPLPPIKEQEKVSGILAMIDKTIELYHEERERLERLKRGLMDLLLTGKVRVKGD
jgi:type I restriction enzyme S subunit